MKREYEIRPIWYGLGCYFGSHLPFVGGMISDHLAHTLLPETYYYDYHKYIVPPELLLSGLNIVFDILYIGEYPKQSISKGLFLGFTTLGYMYNLYRIEKNYTEEMRQMAYEDAVRPWENLRQIAIDRANDEFEEILQASTARNNQSEKLDQMLLTGENNQTIDSEQFFQDFNRITLC